MNTLQVVSLVLIAGGIAWAAWQSQTSKPKPSPVDDEPKQDDVVAPKALTRVEVFERLDELRSWFESQGNEPGAEALGKASHALVGYECCEAEE